MNLIEVMCQLMEQTIKIAKMVRSSQAKIKELEERIAKLEERNNGTR